MPPFPSATLPCCIACLHLRPRPDRPGGWACAAFPEAIPPRILRGEADHRRPLPGDRGIQFQPDPAAPGPMKAAAGPPRRPPADR